MISATFIENISNAKVDIVDVNKLTECCDPSYRVLVLNGNVPYLLINLYLNDEVSCFKDVKCSMTHVVIGCGENVHFIDVNTKKVKSIKCDGYFGYLYPADALDSNHINDDVLVATAQNIMLLSENGDKVWVSPNVGIDGVIVNRIENEIIIGEGELDPPGGWEEFRITLSRGGQAPDCER